jgi:hypothetical protein
MQKQILSFSSLAMLFSIAMASPVAKADIPPDICPSPSRIESTSPIIDTTFRLEIVTDGCFAPAYTFHAMDAEMVQSGRAYPNGSIINIEQVTDDGQWAMFRHGVHEMWIHIDYLMGVD